MHARVHIHAPHIPMHTLSLSHTQYACLDPVKRISLDACFHIFIQDHAESLFIILTTLWPQYICIRGSKKKEKEEAYLRTH